MSVTIEIPKDLQICTNGSVRVEVNHCQSVYDCLKVLIKRFPGLDGEILDKKGTLLLKWSICINDHLISEGGGLSNPVKTGDVITVLPMISGG